MKRILWGLIKIAIVIGLLVWVSYKFFPETFNGEDQPFSDDIVTEEITAPEFEENTDTEEVLDREVEESVVHQSIGESMGSKKVRYAGYTQEAGMPNTFAGSITVHGTTVLSTQLAQAFGESTNDWANLSSHKKTFWILSELVQQDINVDIISSLQGSTISIRNGEVFFSVSGKSKTSTTALKSENTTISVSSRTISTPTRNIVPLAEHLQLNPQTVVLFSSNRASVIYWGVVLDMDSVNSDYQKRPIYQEIVSHY